MQQPSAPSQAPSRYAFAALILANIFLAMGPWMVRLADVGPVAAGFWRLALAIPLLLLIAWRTGRSDLKAAWPMLGMIAVGGLFFAADLAAWHEGILRTKLANATLFGNASSFIFAIYGFVALRAAPRPAQIGALMLAAAGTVLLLGGSYELSRAHFDGDLLTLLAGAFYFFYLLMIDRARRTMAPFPVLALATVAGTLPLLLFALALGERVLPGDWGPLILLSLGSQVIGQGLLVYAIGCLTPVLVGLGLLTQPALTALIGWLVYGERLGPGDWLGGAMICAALVLIRLPARAAR